MGFLKLFKKKDKKSSVEPVQYKTGLKTEKGRPASKAVEKSAGAQGAGAEDWLDGGRAEGTGNSTAGPDPAVGGFDTFPSGANTSSSNSGSNLKADFVPPASSATTQSSRKSSVSASLKKDNSAKRKSSFGILRKPSFNHSTSITENNTPINSHKVSDLPEELLPVVTLINHQQSRSYFKGNCFYYDSTQAQPVPNPAELVSNATTPVSLATASFNWAPAYVELNGNDVTVELENSPTTIINICDCELTYNDEDIILTVLITNQSLMYFQFNTVDELNSVYSAVLLCKFEYQQLQEAYTGALLSSQAIHFSDIRTLLSPHNKNVKEEWCVIRFPFLNDKWIRCYLVVQPQNKIEIYTHSSKAKKHLLSTITNGLSCYTIYPNDPSQVQNNSLMRLYANCYINSDLLEVILNDDTISSTDENISLMNKKKSRSSRSRSNSRSRNNSFNRRLSVVSLRSSRSHDSNLSSSNDSSNLSSAHQHHQRISSVDTTISDSSFTNSKTPKKLSKKSIAKTHLVYIIPESHASVKPCEISLRLLIPILNSYKLYGRPAKFISSRTDKNSLLFGLPQLPNTYYLNEKSSLDLINLNIDNSLREKWTAHDWHMIYKELMSALLSKGWKGGSYQGDLVNMNFSLDMDRSPSQFDFEDDNYDPMEDFVAAASSSANRSVSVPVSLVNE
ncbi:hypothetical protein PMKS-001201 [Pichia membranifaciens]|uniref:Skg3/CAF120-like PH-like domain-containing protein n=1 Tax=Pichia membranifaciens TaxID=4926 RepID=A0A1Q2YEC1_9ASCO|nr:hypothetical protein PMKS-001201 [Pichia membranifaciens]